MKTIKVPKIYLDSSNPEETKKAKSLLGFVDGQTTNPSLVMKHPEMAKYLESGKKITEKELLQFYKSVILEIRKSIAGSISVEIYADWDTKASTILKQAEEMNSWARNLHVKFPVIPEAVKAAHEFTKHGGLANLTLVFDQNQAAAAYMATLHESNTNHQHAHFVSPFVGRWDDRGFLGLDLIQNIHKMYKEFDLKRNTNKSHIEILSASIRSLEHLYGSIFLGADIVTIPLKLIVEWMHAEQWVPDKKYRIESNGLKSLRYENTPFKKTYSDYTIPNVPGSLLAEGLDKFIADWKKILA
ncbi:MAG: transaldolase family protein [bacterium]|nr:transaldolase family protein [bacterium]